MVKRIHTKKSLLIGAFAFLLVIFEIYLFSKNTSNGSPVIGNILTIIAVFLFYVSFKNMKRVEAQDLESRAVILSKISSYFRFAFLLEILCRFGLLGENLNWYFNSKMGFYILVLTVVVAMTGTLLQCFGNMTKL